MFLPNLNPDPDLSKMHFLLKYLNEYQDLASKHGIQDIFQDNGGKLLQILLTLGLKIIPGRTGNDAYDESGNEYEIKTLNCNLTKSFSTNHHVNNNIIKKYNKARWLFAVYKDIELQEVYYMDPMNLNIYFDKWAAKLLEENAHINNPKISLMHVQKHGHLIWKKSYSP